MNNGFIKVCAASPNLRVADTDYNVNECIRLCEAANDEGAKLIVFPKLAITGATCGDLFFSSRLIESAKESLKTYVYATAMLDTVSVIGLPFACADKLYACSAVVYNGAVLGIVPQKNISCDLDMARYFSPAPSSNIAVTFDESIVTLGNDQFFVCKDIPSFKIALEIGEDTMSSNGVSGDLAKAGAYIIANPSAYPHDPCIIDRCESIMMADSARYHTAYIHADPSCGESTTDNVYSGYCFICENGKMIKRKAPFDRSELIITEIDVELLESERRRDTLFVRDKNDTSFCEYEFEMFPTTTELTREYPRNPFIPEDEKQLRKACRTSLLIQAEGLAQRLLRCHAKTAVIGISGGLDSTLALIVAVQAMDILDRPRTDVIAVTMPCFGTSKRTKNNACVLCDELGVTLRHIDILESVNKHFEDIGHDKNLHDAVYENAQARERTQILMDIANQVNGIVVGTGDLSELALGFATYNGDHMSMYSVNASVPKTLIRAIVRFYADLERYNENNELADVLYDILDTPVSPELLPADEDGDISQITEDLVGPYEIHDLYIYYTVKYGFSPEKLFRIAQQSLGDYYDDETLLRWLEVFFKRFFAQQFKRSCMPDGPRATEISLSPRQGWKMPSDAQSTIWLQEIERLKENI